MSYGSLWYGKNTNFPGFLYKKNTGSGVGKSFSKSLICNKQCSLENKYIPGSGVGASNSGLRSIKRRLAMSCSK
jgi:hypothetical protein